MFDNNEVNAYFVVKTMEALLFTTDIEKEYRTICDIIDADNLDYLEMFKELLDNYADFMDYDMKRNIFYITEHFRSKYPSGELREKAFALTNQIVTKVNTSTEKGTKDFIATQLTKRYSATRFEIRRGIKYADITLKYLKADMVDDVYILETHSNLLSDEEFNGVVPLLTDAGNDYLAGINYMLDEFKDLADEPIFVSRVKKCVEAYEQNVRNFDGSDEFVDIKLAKKILRHYKRSSII